MIRTSWRKNAGSRRNKYFARTSGKDATGIHTKDIRLAGHWEGDVRVIPGDHSYKSKPNHELRFANIDDALPSEFKHHPWKTEAERRAAVDENTVIKTVEDAERYMEDALNRK